MHNSKGWPAATVGQPGWMVCLADLAQTESQSTFYSSSSQRHTLRALSDTVREMDLESCDKDGVCGVP